MQPEESTATTSDGRWPGAEGVLVAASGTAGGGAGNGAGEQAGTAESEPVEVILPPRDNHRETRAGDTGSASEANNDAGESGAASAGEPTYVATDQGAAGGIAEEGKQPMPASETEGQAPAFGGHRGDVERDANYRPNAPRGEPVRSATGSEQPGPPPPPPQPQRQDGGTSNTVTIEPEGGSQLNPTDTGEKANTPSGASDETATESTGQEANADRPGYDADGNPLPGTEGRVTLDDWNRLNDLDGDGQIDRNYVDLSGSARGEAGETTGSAEGGGPPRGRFPDVGGPSYAPGRERMGRDPILGNGAPEGTVGDGIPVPGLNSNTSTTPGIAGRLDRNGDGRPDFRVPPGAGDGPPAFTPPGRGPQLTIPEDLEPRQPGPDYEPEAEDTPATNGEVPHREHPQPPQGRHGGEETPPVAGEAPPPAGDARPRGALAGTTTYPPSNAGERSAHASTWAGASPPRAAESLDVFLMGSAAEAAPSGEPATNGVSTEGETGGRSIGGSTAPPPSPWTLTSEPIRVPAARSVEAPSGAVGEDQAPGGDGAPLPREAAALVGWLRSAADATADGLVAPPRRDADDPGVIERVLATIRDLLFMSEKQPSDEELAAQLDTLTASELAELDRYTRERPPGASEGWDDESGSDE